MDSNILLGLAPFILTSLLLELTPGPNMAYLALLSASRGRVPGLYAVVGVALGLAIIGSLAAGGLTALVVSNRWLWEILRWAGIGYLVWLAYDTWMESRAPLETLDDSGDGMVFFRRGLITNLLNPKAGLFYVTVLPSFANPDVPLVPQIALLTFTYVAVATLVHFAIVMVAGGLTPLFAHPKIRRWAGVVFALALVGVAVWVAIKTGWAV